MFNSSSIIPPAGQPGSSSACAIQHKGKRLLCYVRNQQKQPHKQLISRAAVLTTDVPLINSILQPNTDPQCVAFKDALFSMQQLQHALRERGHHDTALALEILGRADMAWIMSGLTHHERLQRLLHLKQLLITVLAPTIASIAQMSKSHVLGAPRDLLWAMLHNMDNYLLFVDRFPVVAEHSVARFWSQDDAEGVFAVLCFLCGYRPGWKVARSRLVHSKVLAAMRRNPSLPFHITISAKRSCQYHAASRAAAATAFNEGSKMVLAAQKQKLDSRVGKAAACLTEMKHAGIRAAFHKGKGGGWAGATLELLPWRCSLRVGALELLAS